MQRSPTLQTDSNLIETSRAKNSLPKFEIQSVPDFAMIQHCSAKRFGIVVTTILVFKETEKSSCNFVMSKHSLNESPCCDQGAQQSQRT